MSAPRLLERIWDAITGFVPWALATLAIAGATHIVSILAMPRLAPKDAFARMAELAPTLANTPLPSAGAPFDDPALAQGVCRFDLTKGPARLRAALEPEELMLFSFQSRYGEIFYSMTDRGATHGRLDVLVLTRAQLDRVEQDDDEDELPQELRVVAPTQEGFVLLRSLAERPSESGDARRRVAAVVCGPDQTAAN